MKSLTENERRLIKQALGLDRRNAVDSYRNMYCATPGSDYDDAWSSLVERGLATKHRSTSVFPYANYSVTGAGRLALMERSKKIKAWTVEIVDHDEKFTHEYYAETRGKAAYRAALDLSDAWNMPVGEAFKILRVTRAAWKDMEVPE